ncbi:MAG: GLPGLI family protein [Mucilaginibacter sp.]|uniref:GLPGLI family protein n=1 Tax=Mucilaginibacter sp. TaxID=1882438 RepID=UPI003267519C
MKNILTLLICFLMLAGKVSVAQNAHFATQGTIEFEKTVNMFALIKKNINKDNEAWYAPLYDSYKRTQPQFKTYKSTLTFADGKTMFRPAEETIANNGFYGNDPMAVQNNTIFSDTEEGRVIMQKTVFDDLFLVKDSTRHINWKITTETRDVAGYKCRRANAIILDSIYVVAFYTDEITTTGGPESFNGLPGMILGVALPHENVTWFATKVSETPVPVKDLAPPTKGKLTDRKSLVKTLSTALKDYGDYVKPYLKAFQL